MQKIPVCGPVGAGKSSLLYAVLGEIPKISGTADVLGSIAYVSQTSWIQRGASPISQDSPGPSTSTGSMQLLLIRTMTVSC